MKRKIKNNQKMSREEALEAARLVLVAEELMFEEVEEEEEAVVEASRFLHHFGAGRARRQHLPSWLGLHLCTP